MRDCFHKQAQVLTQNHYKETGLPFSAQLAEKLDSPKRGSVLSLPDPLCWALSLRSLP